MERIVGMKKMFIVFFVVLVLATEVGAQAPHSAIIDAHEPVIYHYAVTNLTDKVQNVERAWSSCACIKLDIDMAKSVAPNESLPFTAVFNPAGMEGKISKTVSVKLSPSGEIKVFTTDVDVRLRVGFDPIDATFGVVGCGDTERKIIARQSVFGAFHDPTVWSHRSAYLSWWQLSIIVNKNALNEHNVDKIVTVLNKSAYKIAFEGFLCYNHAKKEKNYAA